MRLQWPGAALRRVVGWSLLIRSLKPKNKGTPVGGANAPPTGPYAVLSPVARQSEYDLTREISRALAR